MTSAGQHSQRLIIHSAKRGWLSRGLILQTNPRRPRRSQSVHKMILRALPPPHSKPTRFSNGYRALRSYHGELLFWHRGLREAREAEGETVCNVCCKPFRSQVYSDSTEEEGQILLLLLSQYYFYYSNDGVSAKLHCLHPSLSGSHL